MNPLILISLLTWSVSASVTAHKLTVGIIGDVHLEPNYDPWVVPEDHCLIGKRKSTTLALYGRKKCDSPYSLFLSALQKMKGVVSSPDIILVPGDLVTHFLPIDNGQPFNTVIYEKIKDTIANYSKTVANEFPGVPILFTQGNDDYLYNYQVPDVAHKADYYQFVYDKWIKSIEANKKAV